MSRTQFPELLTTGEVSELLKVPVGTLRYWRSVGVGPKSFTLGARKVAYRRDDVEGWLAAQYEEAGR